MSSFPKPALGMFNLWSDYIQCYSRRIFSETLHSRLLSSHFVMREGGPMQALLLWFDELRAP